MTTLEKWHAIVAGRDVARLPEVLAPDCKFVSPVLHTPQQGRDLVVLYLSGAMQVFNDSFRYVKEVASGAHTVLEFECEVDGILINGVDIMTFDSDGLISEFRVMIRPLKAVHLMQAKMAAMLEQLSA